jgi:hypothetical protein
MKVKPRTEEKIVEEMSSFICSYNYELERIGAEFRFKLERFSVKSCPFTIGQKVKLVTTLNTGDTVNAIMPIGKEGTVFEVCDKYIVVKIVLVGEIIYVKTDYKSWVPV